MKTETLYNNTYLFMYQQAQINTDRFIISPSMIENVQGNNCDFPDLIHADGKLTVHGKIAQLQALTVIR